MHFYIPPRSLKAHDHSPRAGNWRERERKGAKPTIARRLRPRWATLCASGKICAWWKTREIQREKKGTTTTTTHIPNLAQRTRRWYIYPTVEFISPLPHSSATPLPRESLFPCGGTYAILFFLSISLRATVWDRKKATSRRVLTTSSKCREFAWIKFRSLASRAWRREILASLPFYLKMERECEPVWPLFDFFHFWARGRGMKRERRYRFRVGERDAFEERKELANGFARTNGSLYFDRGNIFESLFIWC